MGSGFAGGAATTFFATGTGFTTGAGLGAKVLADDDPAFGTATDLGAFPAIGAGLTMALAIGLATGFATGLTVALALTTGLTGGLTVALALTTGLALAIGFALTPLDTTFTTGFGFDIVLVLAVVAFWGAATGFLALATTGFAFGFALEAEDGLLIVLALATVLGAAFLATAPLEGFAFAGAGLDDLVFF